MKSLWSVVGTVALPDKITIDDVLKITCDTMHTDIMLVKKPGRKGGKRDIVEARKVFAYFCIKYVPKAPLVAIGHAISKDYSTIHYYNKEVFDMLCIKDPVYSVAVEAIDDKLMAKKWSNRYYNDNPQLVGILS